MNLSRSVSTPGAYNLWNPEKSKVVCTSDVFFDDTYMPWRAHGDRIAGMAAPKAAPAESTPEERKSFDSPAPSDSRSLPQAYESSTNSSHASALGSIRALLLFSGPYSRPDGLSAYLTRGGYEVTSWTTIQLREQDATATF